MGWALDNLGSARCKEIAEFLFVVEREYGGVKLHGFCPIHKDKKNASFVYHFEADWYKCKSCGEGGDLVKLWCIVNGHDPQDLKAFRAECDRDYTGGATNRKPSGSKPAVKKPSLSSHPTAPEVFVDPADLQALPPLSAERMTELQNLRGWSPQVMQEMDLREFTDAKGNKRIAIPIMTDDGRIGNIRLYQPGAEQFKLISWYDQKCKACGGHWKVTGKKKVCKECGTLPNDYGRARLYPSPNRWKPGLLWIVEGEPDLACALSRGLNAVTQTAGCGTWFDDFSQNMAGRDVVIGYDADHAGFKGAMKMAESIAEYAKSVRVIVWPELMKG